MINIFLGAVLTIWVINYSTEIKRFTVEMLVKVVNKDTRTVVVGPH